MLDPWSSAEQARASSRRAVSWVLAIEIGVCAVLLTAIGACLYMGRDLLCSI